MPRRCFAMSVMPLWGRPVAPPRRYWLMPIGLRNSSSNTSPGWMFGSLVFLVVLICLSFSFYYVSDSVIVHDLHVFGVSFTPHKTDAPLPVDADAPLPFFVTAQLF